MATVKSLKSWRFERQPFVRENRTFTYFPIFHEPKLGRIFTLSNLWRRSHQTNFLRLELHWLYHTPITNPSRSQKKKEKSCSNCYGGADFFFPLIFCVLVETCATCTGFSTHNLRRIIIFQTAAGLTGPRVRVTDIWVEVALKFVLLERKRVSQVDDKNPAKQDWRGRTSDP